MTNDPHDEGFYGFIRRYRPALIGYAIGLLAGCVAIVIAAAQANWLAAIFFLLAEGYLATSVIAWYKHGLPTLRNIFRLFHNN